MCSEWGLVLALRVEFFVLSLWHCSGDLCLHIISGRRLRPVDLGAGVVRDVSAVGGEANCNLSVRLSALFALRGEELRAFVSST
jgi:hypothetical protein